MSTQIQFSQDLFNEIYLSVFEAPPFTSLRQQISAGVHISHLQYDYEFRCELQNETLSMLSKAREHYSPADWLELFECIESMEFACYYHSFVSLAQDIPNVVFASPLDLQAFTGISEMEPVQWTFDSMLDAGEVWDNRMHASVRIGHVFYAAKTYAFILFVEKMFRAGEGYHVIKHLDMHAAPWYLPKRVSFCCKWYTLESAVTHALCLAYDLFMKDKPFDLLAIREHAQVPETIISQALELRAEIISEM